MVAVLDKEQLKLEVSVSRVVVHSEILTNGCFMSMNSTWIRNCVCF